MPTYRNDTQENQQAENINGQMVMVAPGETIETYQILPGPDWTQTDTEPVWSPVMATHEIAAESAGMVEQAVNPTAGVLEVQADVAVTIHINAADEPGYPLPPDRATQIKTYGRISALHIDFSGAGNATVVELQD